MTNVLVTRLSRRPSHGSLRPKPRFWGHYWAITVSLNWDGYLPVAGEAVSYGTAKRLIRDGHAQLRTQLYRARSQDHLERFGGRFAPPRQPRGDPMRRSRAFYDIDLNVMTGRRQHRGSPDHGGGDEVRWCLPKLPVASSGLASRASGFPL